MKPSKQSKELAGALAEDQKRQAVDAAKKRAVAQQVDYDTFKKMVSVAHLKPLHAPSATSAGCLVPAWGLDPTGIFSAASPQSADQVAPVAGATVQQPPAESSNSEPPPVADVPRTSQEFLREWRRSCPTAAAKYRLLKHCGAEAISQIFKVEITGDLLGQVLLVLQQEWSQQAQQNQQTTTSSSSTSSSTADAENVAAEAGCTSQRQEAMFVVELLHILTGAGRFDLNARLIGTKAKQAAQQLCNDLEAALRHCGDIKPDSSATCILGSTRSSTSSSLPAPSDGSGSSSNAAVDEHTMCARQVGAVQQHVQEVSIAECGQRLPHDRPEQQLASYGEEALVQLAYVGKKLHVVAS